MEIIARLANLPGALPGDSAQVLIWGIMAIGVYLTYRILDVADLTVDGSIATGGAVAVMLIRGGMNCWLALLCAFATGLLAGLVALAIPPLGITLAGAAAIGLAGAMIGTWSSALVGASLPDPIRRKFEDEIRAGKILVIVDGEPGELLAAEPDMVRAGATPLPYEAASALA